MKRPEWFRILEAVRHLAKEKVEITRFSLGEEAEIKPSLASGWLSKFARWQYVRRGRRGKVSESMRWAQVFELTDWGKSKQAPRKAL